MEKPAQGAVCMNSFIISNVRIVTAYTELENAFVYVKRGLIEAIGPDIPGKVHKSCNIIDGRGSWLLPGMIDVYNTMLDSGSSFFAAENSLVNHGVTTVCHFVPDTEPIALNDINKSRRLGIIRHHLRTSPYLNEEYTLISASGILGEADNPSNIQMTDIVENSGMYILCSDCEASAVLEAVFILSAKFGMNMIDAVGTATLTPARAFGIENKLGSIECGKNADLLIVSCENNAPKVEMVFISGCKIYDSRAVSSDNAV